MYLKRLINNVLEEWKVDPYRKPILLRGARQVGKTSAVRELSKSFEDYLEINFEANKEAHTAFEGSLSAAELVEKLINFSDRPIEPGKTLLFFDEIQACPNAIRSLRFFYEDMPELHVIAAGSLLEFALSEIPSYGVGRIRSIFMYPLSFEEFLLALDLGRLLALKNEAVPTAPLHAVFHDKLNELLVKFILLGGMPQVIAIYVQTKDFSRCRAILDDIIISFRDDFAKYKKRVPISRIREVFESVVNQAGGKFIYRKAAINANHDQIKEALDLLTMAGLVIPVTHTSANGFPLGAEVNPKKQKMLLFDTGIFLRILNLDIRDMLFTKEFSIINKGNVAEQYVGLEILKAAPPNRMEYLYYWHREAKSSNAEVDYVIMRENEIVPIEVKAGTKGAMQSMFLFLEEKKRDVGIRVSMENFSEYDRVEVYPLYGVGNIFRDR